MAGGYDKFFKEARKASGLTSGGGQPSGKKPVQSGGQHSGRNSGRNPGRNSGQNSDQNPGSKKFRANIREETPEDRIREELANRMKAKRSANTKRKAKFPVYPMVCTVVALIFCSVGYFNSDLAEQAFNKTLGRLDIGLFTTAKAAEPPAKPAANPTGKEEKTAGTKVASQEKAAETATSGKAAEGPNTNHWTQEELSFFSKLNERKKELDLREAELGKLEEELQKRKRELDEKLKQLEAMRTDISKTLKTRVASDQEKVDKLVQVYATMKPAQASKVISTLDEDLAVEILDKMKKKSAAEILNMMDAKKARRLSELLTGYERSPASKADDEADDGADDGSGADAKPAPKAPAKTAATKK